MYFNLLVTAIVALMGHSYGYLAKEAPSLVVLVVPAPKIEAANY